MIGRAWVYLLASATLVGGAIVADGCGGNDTNLLAGDGGQDGTGSAGGGGGNAGGGAGNAGGGGALHDGGSCGVSGAQCASGGDCCSGTCDSAHTCTGGVGQCGAAGTACTLGTQCCAQTCTNGTCGSQSCTPDNAACTANAQCCGGQCGAGDGGAKTCVPLSTTCSTSGNPCTTNATCCSSFCSGGLCQNPSFCVQTGDSCTAGQACCSGTCNIAAGATVGLCGTAPTGSSYCNGGVDGIVCGSCTDCCSRLCAPYLNTGVNICQPAEGCRVNGDLCATTNDCCGGDPNSGLPGAGNVRCCSAGTSGATCPEPGDGGIGYCANPISCNPEGDVCHYLNYACNVSSARDDCCGAPGNSGACQLDKLGVPRCLTLGGGDAGTCVQVGNTCAFNGDCCNGAPCVPNADGGLVCGASPCSPSTGPCTTTADCCDGLNCNVPPGSTQGTCGTPPSGGGGGGGTAGGGGGAAGGGGSAGGGSGSCAFFGQTCVQTSDCCQNDGGSIQCISGVCTFPIH